MISLTRTTAIHVFADTDDLINLLFAQCLEDDNCFTLIRALARLNARPARGQSLPLVRMDSPAL